MEAMTFHAGAYGSPAVYPAVLAPTRPPMTHLPIGRSTPICPPSAMVRFDEPALGMSVIGLGSLPDRSNTINDG